MPPKMRSHLTPRVFRRLLSSQGLTFRCPSKNALAYRTRPQNAITALPRHTACRGLWGFSAKPERQPREPDLAPGMKKMAELNLLDSVHARPPNPEDLAEAWHDFFKYKVEKKTSINNVQARLALKTLIHLQKYSSVEDGFGLANSDLLRALQVLSRVPPDVEDAYLKVSRLVYEEIKNRVPEDGKRMATAKNRLVRILTRSGCSAEARNLVGEFTNGMDPAKSDFMEARFAEDLLYGFALEGNEAELLSLITLYEEDKIPRGSIWPICKETMIKFYADRNDIKATKSWYEKSPPNSRDIEMGPSPSILLNLLDFCIRNNELDWCKAIFRQVLDNKPGKGQWDVVLQWAAGTMGKGVEDVERMMEVMANTQTPDNHTTPDIATINGLVELSMKLKDSYLAERYIALGYKRGIHPNAKTCILQMNYRSKVGDLSGAQAAYEALQVQDIQHDEDLPAINKYIQALCAASMDKYDLIISIVSDLEERNLRLEAPTTAALAVMYLGKGKLNEALDLLQANAYHYSLSERNHVRESITKFCFDPSTSTAKVWDSYTIMRQVFDETNTETRTNLMNEFFRRGRCDMACYTFGHMRQHVNIERRPQLSTYVECFLGIASLGDRESLEMVHNMLKMDSSIEPNTKLYNALMIAYTECEGSERAIDFWDDITNSREGPNYKSLEIVFRACQRKPFGDKLAREIWAKMRRMEIEITRDVFAAYVGALAGQGKLEDAKQLVEEMESTLKLKVDVQTLGVLYNALPGQNRKDLVEEWAKGLYPEIWKELAKVGQTKQKEGHRLFNIKRDILEV